MKRLMKRSLCLLTIAALICSFFCITAFAASDAPVITLDPQRPTYPEHSVAIYTVKAEGKNLQAFWYMSWEGSVYELSKASGSAQQPWESYAGESYGPRKLDDKTFAYIFEGIGKELNGAYLWCTVEDGHNSVTSQQVQIFVGGEKSPPEITAFPTELNVEQDDLAEIRCVAKSVDGSQLSFTWYETDSGNIEDIRAVNRGTETNDTLVIDTKTTSSKYYICKVESANGGITYSSTVKVLVAAKSPLTGDPSSSESNSSDASTDPSFDTTIGADKEGSESGASSDGTGGENDRAEGGFPWWGILLIVVAAAGAGFGVTFFIMKKKG